MWLSYKRSQLCQFYSKISHKPTTGSARGTFSYCGTVSKHYFYFFLKRPSTLLIPINNIPVSIQMWDEVLHKPCPTWNCHYRAVIFLLKKKYCVPGAHNRVNRHYLLSICSSVSLGKIHYQNQHLWVKENYKEK